MPPSEGAVLVVIECVYYDGQVASTEDDEYVQIANVGDASVNLEGWRLKDVSDFSPIFPFPSHVLGPGETIRVYTNEDHPEWGGFSFEYSRGAIWNNSDPDVAALFNAQGQEVSRKSYPPGC